jgi:hypothetical protein
MKPLVTSSPRPKLRVARAPRPKAVGSKKSFAVKFIGGDLDGRIGYYPLPKGKNKEKLNMSWWEFGIPKIEHCRFYVAKEVRRVKEGDAIEYTYDPKLDHSARHSKNFLGVMDSRFSAYVPYRPTNPAPQQVNQVS